MNEERLLSLLGQIKEGSVEPTEALEQLKILPFEELGFAKLDHHRALRKGFPEVIFAPGKTKEQLKTLLIHSLGKQPRVLATRVEEELGKALVEELGSDFRYLEQARLLLGGTAPKPVGSVVVCCAGTADLPVAAEAHETLTFLGSKSQLISDVGVAGLHRLLAHLETLQGANAIVVVAGMEGALASVVGGLVGCPVIAVPTSVGYGASFQGVAALLTMLNSCASGVTVVNIDNGFGAGYSAHLINRSANPW